MSEKHQTVVIGDGLELPCTTGLFSSLKRWSKVYIGLDNAFIS